jgi:hypothetical protein
MVNNAVDELLYFSVGIALGKLAKVVEVKYGDPKASLNITSLGRFGKPSVYGPLATGAGALGYAGYQADKYNRFKEEELVLAGYGAFSVIDTAAELLTPAPAITAARPRAASGIRIVNRVPVPAQAQTLRGVV